MSLVRKRKRPSLTVIAAVMLVVAGVLVALYEDRLYAEQHANEIHAQALLLAARESAALAFGDANAAQEYVNALATDSDIRAIGAYDSQGTLVASLARRGELAVPEKLAKPADTPHDIVFVIPVREKDVESGTIYVRAVQAPPIRRLARIAGVLLLVATGMLVLAVQGAAHAALSQANAELEQRAEDLTTLNAKLQIEMEERQKTEEALRQSQKMEAIGQLSGGIAHDFNNLLNIIKGNLQLLQRRLAQGRSDVQGYVSPAMTALDRAASLTQRILAFSRKQPLSSKPVSLSGLVDGMKDLLRHSVGETARIELDLASRALVLCDASQMENVVLNLVLNARDALVQGGTVALRTRDVELGAREAAKAEVAPGAFVELSVEDNGTGMPEEVRRRAVDPFFTTKPLGQGTGLGLSMSFGYVRQSNGQLTIESAPGQGTIVRILMPVMSSMQTVDAQT